MSFVASLNSYKLVPFSFFSTLLSINFLLDRTTKFDQNGRVHNEKESKEIDKKIKKLLSKNSIKFYGISGLDSKDIVIYFDEVLGKQNISKKSEVL